MKTNEIKKFIKKNRKPLLIALGVLVAVLVVWLVFFRKSSREEKNQQNASEDVTGASLTDGLNWDGLCARLYGAFRGLSSWLTDEDEVYAVLGEMRTAADWDYLQRHWTIWLKKNNYQLERWLVNHYLGVYDSLIRTMKSELNTDELENCRVILERKNITPGF